MADEIQAENGESRKVAEHGYVGPDGGEVDTINEATGISYTHVRDGWDFAWQIPGAEAGDPQTLLAVFGAKTLATNTTSGARQRDEDEQEALVERFGNLEKGVWRERAEGGGGRGPKYDKDVLAAALIETFKSDGQTPAGDVAHYREKLEDRSYYAKVRANVKVMSTYMTMMAESGKGAPDTGGLV